MLEHATDKNGLFLRKSLLPFFTFCFVAVVVGVVIVIVNEQEKSKDIVWTNDRKS